MNTKSIGICKGPYIKVVWAKWPFPTPHSTLLLPDILYVWYLMKITAVVTSQ